jgi:hypothetical protein
MAEILPQMQTDGHRLRLKAQGGRLKAEGQDLEFYRAEGPATCPPLSIVRFPFRLQPSAFHLDFHLWR